LRSGNIGVGGGNLLQIGEYLKERARLFKRNSSRGRTRQVEGSIVARGGKLFPRAMVVENRQTHLLEIVLALNTARSFAGRLNGRQ
jgi:hypothetical protein